MIYLSATYLNEITTINIFKKPISTPTSHNLISKLGSIDLYQTPTSGDVKFYFMPFYLFLYFLYFCYSLFPSVINTNICFAFITYHFPSQALGFTMETYFGESLSCLKILIIHDFVQYYPQ